MSSVAVTRVTHSALDVVSHRLRFTLVSEPAAEEDDEDCVEIGYAYVSLSDILQSGRDLIGAEIPSQQLTASLCLLTAQCFANFVVFIMASRVFCAEKILPRKQYIF